MKSLLISIIYVIFSAPAWSTQPARTAAPGTAPPPRSGEDLFLVRYAENTGRCATSPASACVIGRMPTGMTVYLLDPAKPAICESRVHNVYMAGFQIGDDFPLMHMDTKPCPSFPFQLVINPAGKPSYQPITKPASAAKDVAAKIDKAVRGEIKRIVPPSTEHPVVLSTKPPRVFRLPGQATTTFIGIYENAKIPGDQTHVLYANGRVKLIHPAANIQSMFVLDQRSYIYYAFSCKLGCGWAGNVVVEFSADDLKTVLLDDSGSA